VKCRLSLALLLLLAPKVANAAGTTCTLSASGVAFGTYNPLSAAPNNATGTVTLRCNPRLASTARISLSTGGGSSYAGRRMTSGSASLPYQLYLDSARSRIWGDGTGGSSFDTESGSASQVIITVYGQIAPNLALIPGSYTDTITATVVY